MSWPATPKAHHRRHLAGEHLDRSLGVDAGSQDLEQTRSRSGDRRRHLDQPTPPGPPPGRRTPRTSRGPSTRRTGRDWADCGGTGRTGRRRRRDRSGPWCPEGKDEPSGAATTSPTISWPITIGYCAGTRPVKIFTSVPHIPSVSGRTVTMPCFLRRRHLGQGDLHRLGQQCGAQFALLPRSSSPSEVIGCTKSAGRGPK